jgi:RNA polymerase sigma factor (sigma-70 family)
MTRLPHGVCGKPYRARQLSADLIALEDALQALEKLDPRRARVVELRFFAGLSQEEVAEALNVSVGTVRRDWSLAEAWLFRELNRKGPTQ